MRSVMDGPEPGQGLDAIDTPALVVDLALMERNIARIGHACARAGVAWRPHCKAHKCPEIARILMDRGAIGVTCAKLSEAEAMAEGGIGDILIANQVVGPIKIARLLRLAERARIIVAVDSAAGAEALHAAFAAAGRRLPVLIEVDSGSRRAGVQPGSPVLALARAIMALPGLELEGLMTWEGHATQIADPHKKREAIERAIGEVLRSAELCRVARLPIRTISCGGTGTYETAANIPGVTEIQAGGGVLGDVHYLRDYRVPVDFALNLVATVTSRPSSRLVITDAGKKSMSMDAALPEPLGLPAVSRLALSAEHGRIELEEASDIPAIGDQVRFAVGYADTTVHLHDRIHAMRDGRIEQVWSIPRSARLL